VLGFHGTIGLNLVYLKCDVSLIVLFERGKKNLEQKLLIFGKTVMYMIKTFQMFLDVSKKITYALDCACGAGNRLFFTFFCCCF
jgi:hypothetical protein